MRRQKIILKLLTDCLRIKITAGILAVIFSFGLLSAQAEADPKETRSQPPEQIIQDTETVRRYASQLLDQNRKANFAQGGFTWDTEKRSTSWRYYNGFMIDAFLRLNVEGSFRYAEAFYRDHILPDGSIRDYLPGYLDSVEPVRPLLHLNPDPAQSDGYLRTIQWVYTQLENQLTYPACGNNYCHHQENNRKPAKSSRKYPIFLDGLYMTQPFLAECASGIREGKIRLTDKAGKEIAAEKLENDIVNRYVWLRTYMFNSRKALYQHGWDVASRKANEHYWGRGIGWLAMSMADVIEFLPPGAGKDRMISMLLELLEGMLNYQDSATGMWFNVVDRGTDLQDNRLETSVTCMMAYALVKAWNEGYAPEYCLEKGLQAFHGVTEQKLYEQNGLIHLRDTCLKSGVGESDEYYCREPYTTDEAKGAAPLLMAAAEIERFFHALDEQ